MMAGDTGGHPIGVSRREQQQGLTSLLVSLGGAAMFDPLTDIAIKKIVQPSLLEHMEQFKKDTDFISQHRLQLRAQYPDQWVLVFGGEVVGAGSDLDGVLNEAGRQGVPCSRAAMEYFAKEPVSLILSSRRC